MSIRLATLNRWLQETRQLHGASDSHLLGLVRYEDTMPSLRSAKVRKQVKALATSQKMPVEPSLDALFAALGYQSNHSVPETKRGGSGGMATKTQLPRPISSNRVTWELFPRHLRPWSWPADTQKASASSLRQQSWSTTSSTASSSTSYTPSRTHYVEFSTAEDSDGDATDSLPTNGSHTKNTSLILLPYSAAGIFMRSQLVSLEKRCLFLSQQTAHQQLGEDGVDKMQEFYSSLQPFQCGPRETVFGSGVFDFHSPEFHCCFGWLLPVRGWEALMVHHLGTPGSNGDMKWTNRHRLPNTVALDEWSRYFDTLSREQGGD